MAHVDQTLESAVKRVRYHLKDEAAELLKGRFRIVKLQSPLVLCDYFNVDKDKDLRASDLVFPHYVGEQWYSHYNPQHKWFYVSDQQPQECWLFKCHDSEGDPKKAAFAIHNSVDTPVPDRLPAPRPRETIEFRCLDFY
ncbi:hypothetical protein B0H67DRAFT_642463 [Lasiosphaeris hirsuta]|uniref:Uncharacterized protein n=1 Tax=Lasiosphaeris hirsuta TaxID=260670 RepID=A0AA40B1V8_9PEZI|nr:hypothetical protein B0H67DRAFT_642463 [Lasiosphaeris hirsuta]